MKKVFIFLGLVGAAFLNSSCSKNSPSSEAQLLQKKVSEVVKKADSQPEWAKTVLIHKEFLNKDLVFGGLMTNLDVFPEIEDVSSELFWPYPTELVRLVYDEEFDVIRVKRSPLKPWDSKEHEAYQQEICSLDVEKKTDNGNYLVDLASMASSLYVNFYGAKGVPFSRGSFIEKQGKVIIQDDYLSFPIDVRYSVDDANLSANLRFYLKKWQPNEKFVRRNVNRHFGFFTLFQFWGLSKPYPDIENLTPEDVIIRWDLEQRTEPIAYIISKDVPESYRDLVKSAIESWNAPLQKLLNKTNDVVTARVQKDDEVVVPGDLRVNYVFWERSPYKGMSGLHASFQVDPISGEIFHSDVYIGGEKLIQVLTKVYALDYEEEGKEKKTFQISLNGRASIPVCNLEPKGNFSQSILPVSVTKDEYVRSWLLESIIHEVGHNFGLRHNFKGSLSVDIQNRKGSHSVMDYIADDVVTSGLGMSVPGSYDQEALKWAYTGEGSEDLYPFCTDEEVSLMSPYYDPLCRQWDFGANPLVDFYEPTLRVYLPQLFEAKDLFAYKWARWHVLSGIKGALQFFPERATVQDRLKANQMIAELFQTIRTQYMSHEKATVVLEAVIKFYFEMAGSYSRFDGVIQPVLVEALRELVLDFTSAQQIPVELKLNVIDSLSKFGNSSQKSNQFNAWNGLVSIRDALATKKSDLGGWRLGQLSREEQFTLEGVNRLLDLSDERLKLFFGERREN